ncbi:hypothetical protein [Brevibacillus borstelensis]|uniref:hypothetical protein n=1 Tax=Brevibacillus borstelensis TaxID=45462 RepID=UPI0030C467E4
MPSTIHIEDIHDYFDRFSAFACGQVTSMDGEQQLSLAPQMGEGTITRIPIRQAKQDPGSTAQSG